jgi:hypothetical protein
MSLPVSDFPMGVDPEGQLTRHPTPSLEEGGWGVLARGLGWRLV